MSYDVLGVTYSPRPLSTVTVMRPDFQSLFEN
jgi:hypothetical protein